MGGRGACGPALALALSALSCAPGGPSAPPQAEQVPFEVELTSPERASVRRHVHATGTLFGEEQTTVAAKVPGRVAEMFVDVGAVLEPGATLAQLETVDYELALNERRRAFEQALARLGLSEIPQGEVEVDELPTVVRARLQAENGHARYERGRLLRERTPPAMSEQDYLDLQTAWSVAKADHRLAQLNARAQLAEARALQAQIDSARQRLTDTLHIVPGASRPGARYSVTARRVSVGDYVVIGAPLFELIDSDPLELRVRVPEREVARVRVGQQAQLRVEAYAEAFLGRVARVNPSVDVRTRTFEVELEVPNSDGRLRAGSFATVDIESDLESGVLMVERASVATFAGVHKVFVSVEGRAQERVVELGPEFDGRFEVVRGLEGSERIVRRPAPGLATGALLRETTGETGK